MGAALLCAVAAPLCAGAADLAAPAAAAETAGPVTGALHRAGRWMIDPQGRVVVLHGVDIVKKISPYYPYNFSAADAEFLANEGLTAARIGFIWAGAEPSPGVYDNAYIGKVLGLNTLLAHYGIRTLIDVHQDDWSQSEPDGDGAPSWATLGVGPDASFEDFWNNDPGPGGVGIQTRFVDLWSHLAKAIDATPAARNLIGIDPFNEPYPGSGYGGGCGDFDPCPAFETTQLHAFYDRVIAAIRATGDRHVIFPEGVADSGSKPPSLPAFSDRQVAFTWHYYCGASQLLPDSSGTITLAACKSQDASAFANLDGYTSRLDVPWIVGEFGASDADAEYAHEIDLMDARFLTWMYWMYYAYTGDPADVPFQSLVENDNKPGSLSNVKIAKLRALVVPYAQAIAGTPKSYAYDRTTRTMTLAYSPRAVPGAHLKHAAETQIFVPQLVYPTGYAVRVVGARVTSGPRSPWVELAATSRRRTITVTITPRTGSTTELPSQTGRLPVAPASCSSARVVTVHVPDGTRARLTVVRIDGQITQRHRGPRHSVRIRLRKGTRTTVHFIVTLRSGGTIHRRIVVTACSRAGS